MPRQLTLATPDQANHLDYATEALRQACLDLRKADCPKTLARAQAALSSAKGAQRHMERRLGAYQPSKEELMDAIARAGER